ncbi:MEP12 [Ectocarpus sp. CCAP 1310/34]|nr:MEP12 [Ectocarpus sp. CCAP 1310/34]
MVLRSAERSVPALAVVAAALTCYLGAVDAACDGGSAPDISWAESSNRLYIDGGCATMADIYEDRSDNLGAKGPLYYFDQENNVISETYTGVYYLDSNIHIRNGATLEIDGTGALACETLLMAGNDDITGSDSLNIRAHGGNLVVRDTKIFSWDITTGTYDTNTGNGRPYLSAITEFITGRDEDLCPSDTQAGEDGYSTGQAKEQMGVARMDIYDSELAYLGYSESESYGISYKARGLCKTLENVDIFDDDQDFPVYGAYAVYGDIYRSKIHNNWFGHYSYGHQGGKWIDNDVYDNVGYGFDPHDDSDHLEIRGNKVWGNGYHGIIASKRCTDITIADNEVWDNAENGIMLHRSCDRATVTGNTVRDSGDAGLSLYESSDCDVYDNVFENNPRGVRWSNGANRNNVYSNTMTVGSGDDDDYAIYLYRGNDEPEADGNPDGHPRDNKIYDNNIYSGKEVAWLTTDADDNEFYDNTFHSGSKAIFEDSTNNLVRDNTFTDSSFEFSVTNSCFSTGTDVPGVPLCDGTDDTVAPTDDSVVPTDDSVVPTELPVVPTDDESPVVPTDDGDIESADDTQIDGTEGIDGNGVVCCPIGCGQCGGDGCSTAGSANGLGSESCCGGGVKSLGVYCDDTNEAPCIIGSAPDTDDVDSGISEESADDTQTCSNGIEGIDHKGEVCCPLACGQCGGTGCGSAGSAFELDGESCCSSQVLAGNVYCEDTNAAPCII